MDRNLYETKIFAVCDLINNLRDKTNKQIISKQLVCEIFNTMTTKPDVPGYWLTDAMESWGKENGFQFVFNVNKNGRRKNIMLIKA